jgi:uncharacterized protein YneR
MKTRITSIVLVLLAAFVTLGGTTSCKSKKQLAKEAAEAEYKSKVEQAVNDLNAILDDETLWTLEEKEARVKTIKDWNLQNAEVDDLLSQVEKKLARERAQKEEEERRAAEERETAKAMDAILNESFTGITRASSVSQANRTINETLGLFESPNVPVLIIISQNQGDYDYDRPTTIEKYLNYLKDQKKLSEKIHEIKYNSNGKIKELELIKK